MRAPVTTELLEKLLDQVATWAAARPDIRAVALVGSYARGTASEESDVDLVILTTSPEDYIEKDDWIAAFDGDGPVSTKDWGAITERRLRRADGLDIEVGIARPSWAAMDPVDRGTHKVVCDGTRIVYDPDRILQRLVVACS